MTQVDTTPNAYEQMAFSVVVGIVICAVLGGFIWLIVATHTPSSEWHMHGAGLHPQEDI